MHNFQLEELPTIPTEILLKELRDTKSADWVAAISAELKARIASGDTAKKQLAEAKKEYACEEMHRLADLTDWLDDKRNIARIEMSETKYGSPEYNFQDGKADAFLDARCHVQWKMITLGEPQPQPEGQTA